MEKELNLMEGKLITDINHEDYIKDLHNLIKCSYMFEGYVDQLDTDPSFNGLVEISKSIIESWIEQYEKDYALFNQNNKIHNEIKYDINDSYVELYITLKFAIELAKGVLKEYEEAVS